MTRMIPKGEIIVSKHSWTYLAKVGLGLVISIHASFLILDKMIIRYLSLLLLLSTAFACESTSGEYVCPPCDQSCDTLTFKEAGTCPHCGMTLMLKSQLMATQNLRLNDIQLQPGSSTFEIEGGLGREDQTIKVFYHQPKSFSKHSKILLVIPGAGRNGDSYRDAWVEESEKYDVLILSPMYTEKDYPFTDYHLGGLIRNTNLRSAITYVENSNQVELDEGQLEFELNTASQQWIFGDFDRIFDLVVAATQSEQTEYDIFGHSAGGQILHRFTIFQPKSKARYILAGNSGFYTLPSADGRLPFGTEGMDITEPRLKMAFSKRLVLFLGELDNAAEQGGTLLRSPSADKQGLHRLARGMYFYETCKNIAQRLGLPYEWQIEVVPQVGHDHQKMGDAAAKFLYE